MKKGILLLFCYFFCAINLNAQSSFVKALGGTGDDEANEVIKTADDNYLIIGSTSSFGSGGSDAYVSKVNGSAKEIWDRAIGGDRNDVFENGIQLSNGDFVLVGWTLSYGAGLYDFLLVRVNNFGDVIWSQSFGRESNDIGYGVMETSDQHLIVAGRTHDINTGENDILIIKTDFDGNEIWSTAYGGSGDDRFGHSGLIEDSQGNYVISGIWSENNGSPEDAGVILKLNLDGDVVSMNLYGGNDHDGCSGFLKENGNSILNIGQSLTWNGPTSEVWMTEFDLDGNVNWSKTIGLPGQNLRLSSAKYLEDGNYLISASIYTQNTFSSDVGILIKVTETGDIIWSKSYNDAGLDVLNGFAESKTGFFALGSTTSHGAGGEDILVFHSDEFGNVSGCSDDIGLISTNVNVQMGLLNPSIEDFSLGEPQNVGVSNISSQETLVCDGCSADDLLAGLYCETAPIICSIDCLDGFTGTLPNDLLLPQPDPLCSGNGIPNNVSWFAFVAGSNTVDLTIVPSNCTIIYDDSTGTIPQTIGIQAGIYYDCSFTSSIACQTDGCMDMLAEDINLESDQFVEGQTYYLFVDGCGGSICDYEVVVNSAQQAFEMDEITTISNNLGIDLEQDTICPGAELTFTLDNFVQDVNFSWSIDPATSDFPTGVHPVTDTSVVTFQFSEEGCFDIHVYAYNECDVSETRTINVCVEALEDEYFSDIYVCQECFPIMLVTPESGCIITPGGGAPTVLIEDPNGDGTPGWASNTLINGPGLDSNLVTNQYGCTFMQYVNVVEIPISPREQVDFYFCLEDFPVDTVGTIFNSPGETRDITLQGAAASGCDSLVSITAHGIDIFGEVVPGDCESGEVNLAFVFNNMTFDDYSSVSYVWYDANLNVVLDNDGIDSVLVVTQTGFYSVQVTVEIDGVFCSQPFGISIDVDNLAPATPSITYASNQVCVSDSQALVYVADQNLGENYVWTLTPNLPITFGLTADTIYVDVTSGQDFEFCVHAVNGCGSSMETCDNVLVLETPDSEFTVDDNICIDSTTTIEYIGPFGNSSTSDFNWNFNGGIITNGMDPNSSGPFEIQFPNAGVFTITLSLLEEGCASVLTTHNIEVVEPFSQPTIGCIRGAGSVTFTWDSTGVEEVDINILSGQTLSDLDSNTYTVSGLNSEEFVNVQFIFNASDNCGGATVEMDCTSLPCPDVELIISLSEQDLCLEESQDIILMMDIIGDNTGTGVWSSPYLYNDSIFAIRDADTGLHMVSYTYELGNCTFTKDTVLVIFSEPDVDIDISPSFCEDMGSNMLDVLTSNTNTVLLDGDVITVLEGIEVTIGDHELSVTNPEGCIKIIEFTVDDMGVTDLAINGDSNIILGETETYDASFISNLDELNLTWTLDGDTICMDCYEVDISIEEKAELCIAIEYGNGCVIDSCMTIEVSVITELHIPNVFSPNGDNINDLFSINSNNSSVFVEEIMIFDRWGELVFNKQGFDLSEESSYWDGTKEGTLCVDGVYVYIISYLDEENRRKKITGDLTLVR